MIKKGLWNVIFCSDGSVCVCTSWAPGVGLTASWGSGAFRSVSVNDAPVPASRAGERHTFSHYTQLHRVTDETQKHRTTALTRTVSENISANKIKLSLMTNAMVFTCQVTFIILLWCLITIQISFYGKEQLRLNK